MDISPIISILGGVIASASFIVSKKENARELIDKLIPFQGIIGLILLFWSIKGMFLILGNLKLSLILLTAVQFIVGFLLSYALLSQYLFSKSDEAKEKGQVLRAKLVQYQVPAGIVLIVLGVLNLF